MYRSPTTTAQPGQTLAVNLDVDVFCLILKCLSSAGLLQMRLASQFAEQESTKEFLARPVWMPRTRRLGAFCKFVLAPGRPDRPSYLQALYILNLPNRVWYIPEDGKAFHKVLTRCTNLRTLHLRWCDRLLMEQPSLERTIAMLPKLTHLFVSRHGKTVQPILLGMAMNMRTSLCSLHLAVDEDVSSTRDVLKGLASVHDHLESLTLQFTIFTVPDTPFVTICTLNLVVPRWLALPPLCDLYSTFPSVRELRLDYLPEPDLSTTMSNSPALSGHDGRRCWRSLDLLRAPTELTHALGITCPVRHLVVEASGEYKLGPTRLIPLQEMIAEHISRLHPRKLTLPLYGIASTTIREVRPGVLLHDSGNSGVTYILLKASLMLLRREMQIFTVSIVPRAVWSSKWAVFNDFVSRSVPLRCCTPRA